MARQIPAWIRLAIGALLPAVIVTALLVLLPRPLFADLWYEHYDAAQEALEEERWSEAIEQITSALEKRGDSAARARKYGMKFTSYFPYLMLGIAYYNLDQLEAALQAFETEERLGAIAGSEEGMKKLRDFRVATKEKQRLLGEEESRRIASIVTSSLGEAESFELDGQLERAVTAVSSALAVEPDNADALATLERLRAKMAERQRRRDLEQRVADLVERGRELLTRGDLTQGSSVLRQALALADNEEARLLLDQAQSRLRSELRTASDERSAAVAAGLDEARDLRRAGRLDEALERLQSVLALDPENADAAALESTLLATRAEEDRAKDEQLWRESIDGFLEAAERALSESRYEDALTGANRVLALDAGNATALAQLARAYRALNVRLLGGAERQNFPPAISFHDQRHDHEGLLAEFVDRRDFRLSGVVIDDSPVEIAFFDGDVEIETVESGRVGELEINELRFAGQEPPSVFTIRSQAVGDLFVSDFQLARDLPIGISTIRLVATDAERLTSSAEYVVVYQRPPWRSPLLWGSGAGLLALAAALLLTARAQRRRRLRRAPLQPLHRRRPGARRGAVLRPRAADRAHPADACTTTACCSTASGASARPRSSTSSSDGCRSSTTRTTTSTRSTSTCRARPRSGSSPPWPRTSSRSSAPVLGRPRAGAPLGRPATTATATWSATCARSSRSLQGAERRSRSSWCC